MRSKYEHMKCILGMLLWLAVMRCIRNFQNEYLTTPVSIPFLDLPGTHDPHKQQTFHNQHVLY